MKTMASTVEEDSDMAIEHEVPRLGGMKYSRTGIVYPGLAVPQSEREGERGEGTAQRAFDHPGQVRGPNAVCVPFPLVEP
jgi:hypothetical protein